MDSSVLQQLRQSLVKVLAADASGMGGGSADVFTPLLGQVVSQGYATLPAAAGAAPADTIDSDQPAPASQDE